MKKIKITYNPIIHVFLNIQIYISGIKVISPGRRAFPIKRDLSIRTH